MNLVETLNRYRKGGRSKFRGLPVWSGESIPWLDDLLYQKKGAAFSFYRQAIFSDIANMEENKTFSLLCLGNIDSFIMLLSKALFQKS